MGLLKKLFGKKDEPKPIVAVKISVTEVPRPSESSYVANIPPLQGDYAKALFLYANKKPSPIKVNDSYQRYLIYECGIQDPSEYHRSLIREGYFIESDVQTLVSVLKVAELKDILTQMGASTSGKKDALIQRIFEIGDESAIRQHCVQGTYMLSEKGVEFLKEHDDYVKLHQHQYWHIDWQEYDKARKPGYRFYDIVWGILNSRILYSDNFGRSEYICMAQLFIEEGKRPNSLEMLLRILYIDTSGSKGVNFLRMYKQGSCLKKDAYEDFETAVVLSPWVTSSIAEYKDIYDEELLSRIFEWKLPVQICSEQLFTKIVQSLMDGTYCEEEMETALKESFIAYVDTLR